MSKKWSCRLVSVAALFSIALATVVGCEARGPAERMGERIDKAVQNAKTRSILPAPWRKPDGRSTGPSNPEPEVPAKYVTPNLTIRGD